MKLVVLYRPNSEHGRLVEDFVHEFSRHNGDTRVEMLNVDSREGGALASLYDILDYPGLLALRDDGSANMTWQGTTLPMQSEVTSYLMY